ncbi:MAG: DUF6033 family protein [Bacteroidales bacterium]|nr:DUF6033 family protein [Clostridium sp.]MCM1204112.1 DUF6033 family protein [Bacteroidales bacterium]
MAITGISNYGNVYEGTYSPRQKKESETAKPGSRTEVENSAKREEAVRKTGNEEYLKTIQSQVSAVTLETGMGLNMRKDRKMGTITINPALLEKMQNDSEAEKKYTQLIKDIERAEKTVTAYYNALGGVVERSSHWYIDEDGKYCHFGYVRRDDRLNKKLREEAKKNTEELIARTREKAAEKKEALRETLEKKAEEKKAEEKKAEQDKSGNVEKLLADKLEGGKDGTVLLYSEDIEEIIEAVKKEERAGGNTVEEVVGANLDRRV